MEFLNRFLAPKQPKTNTDTNLLKLIAMITMFIDHTGKMFFSSYPVMRIIGRMAFPIYAYCLAVGAVYTKHPTRYVSRMVLLALISQPFYAMGLAHSNAAMFMYSFAEHPLQAAWAFYINSWHTPSILFELTMGLILLLAIRNREYVIAVGMMLLCWKLRSALDYSYGILLMALFYLTCGFPVFSAMVVTAFMAWWGMKGSLYTMFGLHFSTQMFALAALPLIYIPTESGIRLPKWLFYSFYPAHLALIWFFTAGFVHF